MRSESLQRREEEYITAADSAGASTYYIIRRHIVPNVSNTVITATTLLLPGLLLSEAGLAFIGLGDPTLPSWGQIIASGPGRPRLRLVDLDHPRVLPVPDHPRLQLPRRRAAGRARPAGGRRSERTDG
ncbi:MAG: ABC transporter permease subunit [Halobacteriales archaeon]|nr:ABC transporter permease subunit [Halobacteriales archaeon]